MAVAAGQTEVSTAQQAPEVRVKRHPHYGRHVTAVVVLLVAGMLAHSVVTNPRYEWGVVGHYFLSPLILQGLFRTLELTAIAMLIGVSLGTILAVMRGSDNYILSGSASLYIWFFRGTPLLAQLIFWYNLAALYPHISLALPFGPTFFSGDANQLITVWTAACLGLGLCEAGYEAEIVRAGIASVDSGQIQAALALGMRRGLVLRRVILPQAMRVIVPPVGNQVIGMLKTTSLVSVLAFAELLYTAQTIYSRTFQTIPLLIVATFWYLILTTVLSVGQVFLERRFSRGSGVISTRGFGVGGLIARRRQIEWLRRQSEAEADALE